MKCICWKKYFFFILKIKKRSVTYSINYSSTLFFSPPLLFFSLLLSLFFGCFAFWVGIVPSDIPGTTLKRNICGLVLAFCSYHPLPINFTPACHVAIVQIMNKNNFAILEYIEETSRVLFPIIPIISVLRYKYKERSGCFFIGKTGRFSEKWLK